MVIDLVDRFDLARRGSGIKIGNYSFHDTGTGTGTGTGTVVVRSHDQLSKVTTGVQSGLLINILCRRVRRTGKSLTRFHKVR